MLNMLVYDHVSRSYTSSIKNKNYNENPTKDSENWSKKGPFLLKTSSFYLKTGVFKKIV